MINKKVCVFGLGYIGLPTALLIAGGGHDVVGFDLIKEKVDQINSGKMPFKEKGLPELFTLAKDNFRAVNVPERANVFIIAVPTPITEEKKCDLSYVESATKSISSMLEKGNLVILESTVKPKTTMGVVKPLLEESGLKCGEDFFLAYVSEKAIPGNTIEEMKKNTRIIGGFNEESAVLAKNVYDSFVEGKICLTDCTTAETVKLLENTYRDANIALANEFLKISEGLKINVWEAIKLANEHPRVNIHSPGPGVGGHCIAVDPWFLVGDDPKSIIKQSRAINDSMPAFVVDLVKKNVGIGSIITVLGASYKPNVDDVRGSPAMRVIKLLKDDFQVKVTDPFAKGLLPFSDAVKGSDCVLVITDHDEYRNLLPDLLSEVNQKLIIDTRNCIDKEQFMEAGFNVIILGDYK